MGVTLTPHIMSQELRLSFDSVPPKWGIVSVIGTESDDHGSNRVFIEYPEYEIVCH